MGLGLNCFSMLTSLATIIYFGVKLGQLGTENYIYEYKQSNCSPTGGYAMPVSCKDKKDSGWISMLTDKSGRLIVDSPFAIQKERSQAIDDRYRVIGYNYTCMCKLSIGIANGTNRIKILACSVWPDCIIDQEFVKYIQHDNQRFIRTYVAFILASVIGIAIGLPSIPISVRTIQKMKENDEGFVRL